MVVSCVKVDTVEPRVHTGVPEALDVEHRLLGRAEHGERLVVEFTSSVKLFCLLGHVDNIVLRKHLSSVGFISTVSAQGLTTCVAVEHCRLPHLPQWQTRSVDTRQKVVTLAGGGPAHTCIAEKHRTLFISVAVSTRGIL